MEPDNQKLQDWLTVEQTISADEAKKLKQLSKKLLYHVHDWNEEELKIYFLALILDLIEFLVASGTQSPKEPFFFIHEYKKQLDTSNDPLGQLLAAMVAAQKLNLFIPSTQMGRCLGLYGNAN
jgi:hypothetical protein